MKRNGRKTGMSVPAVLCGAILFICICIILDTGPDRLIGAAFCHQLPSRSPSPDFPFCFRCAGLFSGIFWSILFSYLSEKSGKLFEKKVLVAFASAFFLFLLDVVNKTELIPVRWYEDKAVIRFLSSYPLGFMLARLMTAIWLHFFDSFRTKKILRRSFSLPFSLITAAVSFLIVFSGKSFLLHSFGYFIAAGSLFFLLILYSLLIQCIGLLKNRSFPDRTVLLSALFIALLQICCFGGLHLRFLPPEVFDRIR